LTNNQEIMGEVRTALWLMKNDRAMEPDNLPAKVWYALERWMWNTWLDRWTNFTRRCQKYGEIPINHAICRWHCYVWEEYKPGQCNSGETEMMLEKEGKWDLYINGEVEGASNRIQET